MGICSLQNFQLTQPQHCLKNVFCIHFEGFKIRLNKFQDKVNFLSTWIFIVSLVSCLPSALTEHILLLFPSGFTFSCVLSCFPFLIQFLMVFFGCLPSLSSPNTRSYLNCDFTFDLHSERPSSTGRSQPFVSLLSQTNTFIHDSDANSHFEGTFAATL